MDYRMPLYIQLQDIIIKKIEDKKYLPGEAIPSERKMAEVYGVNRMTVKRAVEKLVEKGYLIRRAGAGTYVNRRDEKKIDLGYTDENGNAGITAQFKKVGIQIQNKVFGKGDICGSRFLCYKLARRKEETIWGIHRVRIGDGTPFAVEYTYLPKEEFEDVDTFDFSMVSLYDYMEANGHLPIYFTQTLTVCDATEKIAELLEVKKGTTIFKVEYQGADRDYNIVEYTNSYINPSFAKFSFIAQANKK